MRPRLRADGRYGERRFPSGSPPVSLRFPMVSISVRLSQIYQDIYRDIYWDIYRDIYRDIYLRTYLNGYGWEMVLAVTRGNRWQATTNRMIA